jgi:hypothetical protein
MEDLREIFGDGALTYEQFSEKLNSNDMKGNLQLVNLKSGGYVSKEKFDAVEPYKRQYDALDKTHKDINSKYQTLLGEVEKKEKLSKISDKVDKQYADYVYYKAESLVDDKINFDKALDIFLKDNPQYAVPEQNEKKPIKFSTGFSGKGESEDEKSTSSATMNNLLLKSVGRTQK